MSAGTIIANLLNGGTGTLVKSIGDIAKQFIPNQEDNNLFKKAMQDAANAHMETMTKMANDVTESYVQDVANARSMQMTALNQGDLFSKRFIYWLAAGLIAAVIGYDFCFFYVPIPPANKEVVSIIVGVLNTSCLVMIVGFFYGSSKGSADKQQQIEDMLKKN